MLSDLPENKTEKDREKGLNPCSNGICSLTANERETVFGHICLNPCSNGICSLTLKSTSWTTLLDLVLILVLMEYAL